MINVPLHGVFYGIPVRNRYHYLGGNFLSYLKRGHFELDSFFSFLTLTPVRFCLFVLLKVI